MIIYYGSAAGYLPENRKSLHVPGRSQGCLIADFNRDGYLDIAVACMNTDQVIFYWGSADGFSESNRTILHYPAPVDLEAADLNNDGHRFKSPRVQYLPATGPHQMWVQDIGNLYTRRYEETFTSRVLTWTKPSRGGRLAVDAATPFGSRVGLQVRSAADKAGLASAPWRAVSAQAFELSDGDRALQYRLDLTSWAFPANHPGRGSWPRARSAWS